MSPLGPRLRAIVIPAICVASVGCDVRDAMTTDVEIVAQAGEHELTVDELADMVAPSNINLTRATVERWAQLWIDYSLFAQRMALGDSLLDTLSVASAMWYDVDSLLVARFRAHLMDSLVRIDDAVIDSVYAADEHRLVELIVVQLSAEMSPHERRQRELAARRLRARVSAGTSWQRVTADLDPEAGAQGGRMLVTRAGLPPALADTVFALSPGELSGVIETQSAFYIVRRPPPDETREDLARALRDTMVSRREFAYFDALPEKWNLEVASRAPALVRQAARYPHQAASSDKPLGTFRGGSFTVADFVRWLPMLPMQGQVVSATDDQIAQLIRALIQSELLFLEARERGIGLDSTEFRQLKDRLAQRIADVREALGLDVLLTSSATPELLRRMVQLALARHISEVLKGQQRLALVPPFLAEMLRKSSRWDVSYAAVDRAVERARTTRFRLARAGGGIRPPLPAASQSRSEDR